MAFGRIAPRMAPGMFVPVFGLWLEREESGRTDSPSAVLEGGAAVRGEKSALSLVKDGKQASGKTLQEV